jgi:hypothetical protein
MKNKETYITLVLILIFGMTSFAFAQNNTEQNSNNPTVREQVRDIKSKATADINEVRNEARNEIQGAVSNTARQRVENRYNKITNRFQATIERLETIIYRMETRMAKINAEVGNTTSTEKAVTEIANAKKAIADAKISMITLKNTADLADSNLNANASTTKEFKMIISNLQKASTSTQKLLKQAHTSLIKSIGFLKGLRVGQTATTTPSTN